jgi:hypothetical protein
MAKVTPPTPSIPTASVKYGDASLSGPTEWVTKIAYLFFPLLAFWLISSSLDKGRTFFERRGYVKTVWAIFISKIIIAISAIGFIIFCFLTKRL